MGLISISPAHRFLSLLFYTTFALFIVGTLSATELFADEGQSLMDYFESFADQQEHATEEEESETVEETDEPENPYTGMGGSVCPGGVESLCNDYTSVDLSELEACLEELGIPFNPPAYLSDDPCIQCSAGQDDSGGNTIYYGQSQPGSECNAGGECENADECPTGMGCYENECSDCGEDSHCTELYPGGEIPYCEEGYCVECKDDTHCPENHTCSGGYCEDVSDMEEEEPIYVDEEDFWIFP